MEQKSRDYNMELFRMLAMLFVVLIHCIQHSNLIDKNSLTMIGFSTDFLNNLATTCNGCFIMISGYYMINSKFNFKKVLSLWGKTLFYSISIYLFYLLITGGSIYFYESLVPILSCHYWFISAYILLYLIFPCLNMLIKTFSRDQFKYLLLFLTLFVGVLAPFFNFSNSILGNFANMIYVYFLGAYIRLYFETRKEKSYYLLKFFIIIFVITLVRYLMSMAILFITSNNWNDSLVIALKYFRQGLTHFANIFTVSAVVSLFMKFKTISIKNSIVQKIIAFTSPSVFSIYLIHENIINRNVVWIKFFDLYQYSNSYMLPIYIILATIIVFLVCLVIDFIRRGAYCAIKKIPCVQLFVNKLNDKLNIISKKVQSIFDGTHEIKQSPIIK